MKIIWVGLAIASGYLVAPRVKQLWVDWIWTPNCLVQCCKRQGIPGFSHHEILKVLQLRSMDTGQSWTILNSLRNHGMIFYTRVGKFVRLCVADPVFVRQILIDNAACYEKPSFIRSLSAIGDGIFSAAGKDWFHQRQIFQPRFLSKEIKRKLELIKEAAIEALYDCEQNLQFNNEKEIDVYQKFLELTLNSFGKFTFGSDLRSPMGEIFRSFDRYLYNNRKRMFGLASRLPGLLSLPTSVNQEIKEDEYRLQMIAVDLLEKETTRQHFEPDEEESLLALMLRLLRDEKLTEKQVIDNCVTFLLVGHETTASLLAWTTYLLALHPDWQERTRVEAAELCQKDALQWSDLSHLKTLNMILHESLRMFPPQPLVGRTCVSENSLGQFVIPKKLEVFIPIVSLHYSKEFWGDDADEFRPERFANGLSRASNNPLAFLPFGSGPRTCIGQVFALTEARVVLAMMLNKFSWKLSPQYQHCPDVALTLYPSFGMPIVLKKLSPP